MDGEGDGLLVEDGVLVGDSELLGAHSTGITTDVDAVKLGIECLDVENESG